MEQLLKALGVEVFEVGGCVRDRLLGLTPKDIDLASCLPVDEAKTRLEAAGLRTFDTGLSHGTVSVMVNGEMFELTTFRTDVSSDGRHAEVAFVSTVEEDLARRDFTVNAMARSLVDGRLVDPFGGQQDLAAGVLRCVGDPAVRFEEDFLRVVRLCRFAARFGFVVDPATWSAAVAAAPRVLGSVSVERVVQEMDKAFAAPRSEQFLQLMWDLGLLVELLPEFEGADKLVQNPAFHPEGTVWTHTLEVVSRAEGVEGKWAALLHDVGKMKTAVPRGTHFTFPDHEGVGADLVPALAKRLKLSTRREAMLTLLVKHHMTSVHLLRTAPARRVRKVRQFQGALVTECKRAGLPFLEVLDALHQLAKADAGDKPRFWELFTPVDVEPRVKADFLMREKGFLPGPALRRFLAEALRLQLATGELDPERLFLITSKSPRV